MEHQTLPFLILGSRSPRRSLLLTEAGYRFTIRVEETDESFEAGLPCEEVAELLALRKAAALVPGLDENEVLLTADSVVMLDGAIFNKPEDFTDGVRILSALSGKTHTVATGVCLSTPDQQSSFSVFTRITFDVIHLNEIEYYLSHFAPYDKAGSYGIQDWIGLCKVASIEGSYSNVMGLPVREVYQALSQYRVFPSL